MINRIVAFSLRQPLFIMLGLVLFIAAGVAAFNDLAVEAFPDVSDTQATVITLYPGRAAEEVEKQVTTPLEIALSGLPHSVRMFSHTQFGLSYLVLTFDDQASDLQVRQLVAERLNGVDLPPGITPQLQPSSSPAGEVFRFRLQSDLRSDKELRTLQDWVVEKALRQVPGVADLVTMGGEILQYVVQPDLHRMRDYHVTLQQLFGALQRASANAGGGSVEQGQQQFLLRGIGLLKDMNDIGDVVVAENKGVAVHVRDIAKVIAGAAPRQGIVGEDNDDDVVNGIVVMRKGDNPTTVLEGVKAKIRQLNADLLPKDVKILPYYDRQWLIDKTLHTVFHNLLEGAFLVVGVLMLFLGSWRAAMIVALVIPLALLSTFLGLKLVGVPANLLSLGAMDFGILVDGAVIVIENIVRRMGENPAAAANSKTRRSLVLRAATEVGRPTLFSMVIIIAAHIPIFSLQRQEGRIFSPMAYSVTSALIGSLIVSLTLVPLLSWLLLRVKGEHGDNKLVQWCKRGYQPMLTAVIDRPKTVLALATIALLGSFAVGSTLGSEFLPELNEGTTWVNVSLPSGLSITEAGVEVARLRKALHTVPEVEDVISKAGRPEDGTDPKLINSVEIFVGFKPEEQWRKGVDRDGLIKQMDSAISGFPGISYSFSQPIRDNVLESISQVDGQIVVKVFGDDLDQLNIYAKGVLAAVRAVQGVTGAAIDREGSLPQYRLEVDRGAAARFGINVADVQDVVETALAGKAATVLYNGEKHFDVVVRLSDEQRQLAALKTVLVAAPDGAQVPLSELVNFKASSGAQDIARQDGTRVVSVGVFLRGRDLGSVVKDMQVAVAQQVHLAEGYRINWAGEFENQQRAMKRLAVVVPISVLLIFMLLFNAFGSLRSAALTIANIPLALIGGIIALWLTGIPLSVSAAIGFIALFGQAVLNGVVLISYFNDLRDQGYSARNAVLEGSMTRLRTVLMTALLAMLGLLPMALSHGIGSETQRPLAVVIIGGLVSATILTLLVLPAIYVAFDPWRAKDPEDTLESPPPAEAH